MDDEARRIRGGFSVTEMPSDCLAPSWGLHALLSQQRHGSHQALLLVLIRPLMTGVAIEAFGKKRAGCKSGQGFTEPGRRRQLSATGIQGWKGFVSKSDEAHVTSWGAQSSPHRSGSKHKLKVQHLSHL